VEDAVFFAVALLVAVALFGLVVVFVAAFLVAVALGAAVVAAGAGAALCVSTGVVGVVESVELVNCGGVIARTAPSPPSVPTPINKPFRTLLPSYTL
jgi:hypothetical protein